MTQPVFYMDDLRAEIATIPPEGETWAEMAHLDILAPLAASLSEAGRRDGCLRLARECFVDTAQLSAHAVLHLTRSVGRLTIDVDGFRADLERSHLWDDPGLYGASLGIALGGALDHATDQTRALLQTLAHARSEALEAFSHTI